MALMTFSYSAMSLSSMATLLLMSTVGLSLAATPDEVSLLQLQQQVLKRSPALSKGFQQFGKDLADTALETSSHILEPSTEPSKHHALSDKLIPVKEGESQPGLESAAWPEPPVLDEPEGLTVPLTVPDVLTKSKLNLHPPSSSRISLLEKDAQADVKLIHEELAELMELKQKRKQREAIEMIELNAITTDGKLAEPKQNLIDGRLPYGIVYAVFLGVAGVCFVAFLLHMVHRNFRFKEARESGRFMATASDEAYELGHTFAQELGKCPFVLLGAVEVGCVVFFLTLAFLWSHGYLRVDASSFALLGVCSLMTVFLFCGLTVCQTSVRAMHDKYEVQSL
jgi:hypothetical protein